MSLTPSQQAAFDIIMEGENTFLSAPGGAGKSFLIREIVSTYEKMGKSVAVCAPTGIAAINAGGSTIHRLFGFPSAILYRGKDKPIVRTNSELKKLDVLIIDEISMCRIDVFSAVVASLQKIEAQQNRKIQIIVCGDFHQLPPVVPEEDQEYLDMCAGVDDATYAFLSPQWQECNFRFCELCEIVRQDDPEMIKALLQIRQGDSEGINYFNANCCGEECQDAPYLFGTIRQVQDFNQQKLSAISAEATNIPAVFDGVMTDSNMRRQCGYPDAVSLKVGARVMATANATPGEINSEGPYHNGSCGWISKIAFNGLPNDFVSIDFDNGVSVELYRRTMAVYGYSVTKYGKLRRTIIGSCTQFPLQLAYAVTVHKSQGQTLSGANIDPYSFTHGQLYVALSRVKSAGGLRLLKPISHKDVKVDPRVTAFYDGLQNESEETQTVEKKVGRPSKYGQPTTTIRIPEGDAEAVRAFLESLHRND